MKEYAYVKKYRGGYEVSYVDSVGKCVWIKIPKGDSYIEECVDLESVILWSDFIKREIDPRVEATV